MKSLTPAQTTLKSKVTLRGVGLHSGKTVTCTIHPAPAGHGLVFLRSDLKSLPAIKAEVGKVLRTDMCTTLGESQESTVATVEHLLAAFRGLGVDNALIELDAPEVPIMDGSAREFADAMLAAGIRTLNSPRRVIRLKERVEIANQDKWVIAEPSDTLSIAGAIAFNHQVIGEQKFEFSAGTDFNRELASARTFGFLKEVEYLHRKGLALGGSLDNAVVLDDEKILNPDGLRYENEFARHKVLDCLGDFALFGLPFQANVQIFKSGHEMHAAFIRHVLSNPSLYEVVELAPRGTEATSEPAVTGLSGAFTF